MRIAADPIEEPRCAAEESEIVFDGFSEAKAGIDEDRLGAYAGIKGCADALGEESGDFFDDTGVLRRGGVLI